MGSVRGYQRMLQKIERHFFSRNSVTLLAGPRLSSLTRIYSPGHAVLKGNEKADKLSGTSSIQGTLKWTRRRL